jgi:hypothetical protein
MAHLIFRRDHAHRVITTGIEIESALFEKLKSARYMKCRFCDRIHAWELVEQMPMAAALMSVRAEDFLGRCVQSEIYAAQTRDPWIRELHERMAGQWYRLALEHEAKADVLR